MEEKKALREVYCPMCCRKLDVQGERTETFSQCVVWCRYCRTEFVVNYFRAVWKTLPPPPDGGGPPPLSGEARKE